MWVISGYTCDFNIYTCKGSTPSSEQSLSFDVVMKLVAPFEFQGYELFTDNFYSSPSLFDVLLWGWNSCHRISCTIAYLRVLHKSSKSWWKPRQHVVQATMFMNHDHIHLLERCLCCNCNHHSLSRSLWTLCDTKGAKGFWRQWTFHGPLQLIDIWAELTKAINFYLTITSCVKQSTIGRHYFITWSK